MPVIQCNPLTTDDVNYVGNPDSCIPLTFNEKLTAVLNKIVTYLKNRLFGIVSNSLVVTAVNNNCDKYQRIELVPSTNAGNILTLGTDGYPFVPTSSGNTANNGLTKTLSNIQLGGPLIKDTLIDPSVFTLTIQNDVGIGIVPFGAAGTRPRLSVSRSVIPNNEAGNFASLSALEYSNSGEVSNGTTYAAVAGTFGFNPSASRTLLPNTHYSGLMGIVSTASDFSILDGMLSGVSAIGVFSSQTVGAFGTHGKLSKYAGFRARAPLQDAFNSTKEFGGINDVYGLYVEQLRLGDLSSRIDRSWGVYQVGTSDQNFFAGNILADKLKTTSVPPVTTGIRKMVVSDENGLLSSGGVTGFAVTGNTRTSEFGAMEFFPTLTLANASAVAGETVLIYNDTVENLTVKAGVNYQGVGVHSVGNLTGNFLTDGNSCFISNLTFLNLTLTGFTEIDCSNVQFDGVHNLSTNASVNNAVFIGGSGRSLTCNTVSKLSNCLIYCVSELVDNINVTNCRFIDKSANVPGIYFVTINNTSGGSANNFQLIFSNNYIESENNQGLYLITRAGIDIRSVVSNNTIKTKTQTGALVHLGGVNENESGTFFSNNTITNLGPNSALILYNVSSDLVEPAKNLTHNNIVGNNSYSVSGPAIQSILCGMKNCHGYSENSFGILIDSQEEKSSEIRLIDCTGESKTSNGLRALRDIYVVGGTYISGKDAVDGNPIYISNTSQNSVTPNYYFIAGVKTLAYNTSAYAIVSPVAINAKIVGCIFLNERVPLGTPVEGIDTTNITPEPTLTDAYGNII
jgi:hypothetical protein